MQGHSNFRVGGPFKLKKAKLQFPPLMLLGQAMVHCALCNCQELRCLGERNPPPSLRRGTGEHRGAVLIPAGAAEEHQRRFAALGLQPGVQMQRPRAVQRRVRPPGRPLRHKGHGRGRLCRVQRRIRVEGAGRAGQERLQQLPLVFGVLTWTARDRLVGREVALNILAAWRCQWAGKSNELGVHLNLTKTCGNQKLA